MSIVRIPTSPMPQRFLITLSAGQTYQLVTQYRDAPEAGWTLDIGEPNGTPIISGIPLVTGVNLLAQYQHLIVGSLFVLSDVETWAVPGFSDLGVSSHLYFDGDDPFADEDGFGDRKAIDIWTFYGWLGFEDQIEYGAVTFAEEGYIGPEHHLVEEPGT